MEALQHLVVVADQVDQVAVQVDHLKRLMTLKNADDSIYLMANIIFFFQKNVMDPV